MGIFLVILVTLKKQDTGMKTNQLSTVRRTPAISRPEAKPPSMAKGVGMWSGVVHHAQKQPTLPFVLARTTSQKGI